MVAHTLQKALPDLTYIALTILMIMPILAVLLCLFETHHDDGFFTYRGLLLLHHCFGLMLCHCSECCATFTSYIAGYCCMWSTA